MASVPLVEEERTCLPALNEALNRFEEERVWIRERRVLDAQVEEAVVRKQRMWVAELSADEGRVGIHQCAVFLQADVQPLLAEHAHALGVVDGQAVHHGQHGHVQGQRVAPGILLGVNSNLLPPA